MTDTTSPTASAPDLGIPPSPHTVNISIINTTAHMRGIPTGLFFDQPIKGHEWVAAPIFSFLIQHPTLHRSLLFDLGIRKDWENLSPWLLSQLKALGSTVHTDKDVREILDEAGIDTGNIEAIVWSHYHFDHTGDPSRFGPDTALIVGPGFREHMLPGYPANPESPILESDYADRELIELDFASGKAKGGHSYRPLTIGRFRALDYFHDGSFYLLDAPGHTVGHICALARVTPSSFVLLSGDAFHHVGEIRPSRHLPLPDEITPSPFAHAALSESDASSHGTWCPGALFRPLLASKPPGSPFYSPRADLEAMGICHSLHQLLQTREKVQEADAHDNILVAGAHDESLLDVVGFFPRERLNGFVEKEWVTKARWRFLRDFAAAVGGGGGWGHRASRSWGPGTTGGDVEEH